MSDIYLIGTGGLAREVLGWLKAEKSTILNNFKGFITTDSNNDVEVLGYPVYRLNDIKKGFYFIPTIGNPKTRIAVINDLINLGGLPYSFISNDVLIGLNVSIGNGCIINPRSTISSDVIIGDYVLINCNTGIGHDCKIANNVTFLGASAINGDVVVEENCTIGSGVVVYPGKNIGEGATVGIGSVVIRNVKPNKTVIGNPAKEIF